MTDATVERLNAALEGRYVIERELGEGGMATVYLADDIKHERKVALKVLKPELAAVVGAPPRGRRDSRCGRSNKIDPDRILRKSPATQARRGRCRSPPRRYPLLQLFEPVEDNHVTRCRYIRPDSQCMMLRASCRSSFPGRFMPTGPGTRVAVSILASPSTTTRPRPKDSAIP